MSPEQRLRKDRDLLDLCIELQGTKEGLSLDDVAESLKCARRTAKRRMAALRSVLGPRALEQVPGSGRTRRWRLRHPVTASLIQWDPSEVAALETAVSAAERDGRGAEGRLLRGLLTKLRALTAEVSRSAFELDVEALVEIQGLAMRAGPQPQVDLSNVEALRRAILGFRKVVLHHRGAEGRRTRRHVICPLGFLYGSRHYLVALRGSRRTPVLYRLSRITNVVLLEEDFEYPTDFDLRRYAENSFGVFQEDPMDVAWRFRAEVAAEASEFLFHPRQETEWDDDGALIVRFRAGGLSEMAWHLFTWGTFVEVLKPAGLRVELIRLLREALATHDPSYRRRSRQRGRSITP